MRPHSRTQTIPVMRRGTRTRRLGTAGAVALTMLVTGCGGAEEQTPPAPTQTAPSSASEPPASTDDSASSAPATEGPAANDTATDAPSGEAATSPTDADEAQEVVITISDFAYDVPDRVAPGTQVTVRNEDGVGHTVTSDEEGLFDVLVGPGQEETFTVPDKAGEYSFFCKPHPNMVDTLVIG